MSPRAVDKRARPGNEDTPAPAGPALTPADFDSDEPIEVEADEVEAAGDEVKSGAAG